MNALKLSRNGIVAKIILWDTRDENIAGELTRLAKQGVCQVFWEFIFQVIFCLLFRAFAILVTAVLAIISTVFVLPFRFLIMGERLDYNWFKDWRGRMFVDINWMPKNKDKKTVGPLATSFMLKVYAWIAAIYCVVATIVAIGSLFGLWKIEGAAETASIFPGVLVVAILVFAIINNMIHDFFKSLKKKSEVKKLASAYVEAKSRRLCSQIIWTD